MIFFGRERETDALIARLRGSKRQLLAVVGASGIGRSSLVYAGLLPRLRENAVEGSATWQVVCFQPGGQGGNPFLAVANALLPFLPQQTQETIRPFKLAEVLENDPATVAGYADQALTEKPTSAQLVLFVDQLEELFTQVAETYRQKFVDLLQEAARHPRVRVLVTLRVDYFPQFQLLQSPADPLLTEIEPFFVAPPGSAALTDIIRRPAQVAGVTLEDGVADKILQDAGIDPGALPLVAFCLNKLYINSGPERRITLRQYRDMGGLHEAIGIHAVEVAERILKGKSDGTLEILFSKLVTVNRDGHVVRRRAPNREFDRHETVSHLVRELSRDRGGRLLTVTKDTVELSHDALLDKWPMLKDWIERNRADMQRWAELEHDAKNWLMSHDNSLLWKGRRLQQARKLLKRGPLYHPNNITIDDMKRFIKASIMARWKTRAYVSFISSIFAMLIAAVFFAVIMVYPGILFRDNPIITPSFLTKTAMPVGSFGDDHPFGLYDVLGNVWEWTQDCLTPSKDTQTGNSTQAKDTQTGNSTQAIYGYDWCLARGGSWDNYEEWKVRASYRLPLAKGHKGSTVGFRVVREDLEVAGSSELGKKLQECKDRQQKLCLLKDCTVCPQMVILEGREFQRRAPPSETAACVNETTQSKVTIKPLAIGQYEVTRVFN